MENPRTNGWDEFMKASPVRSLEFAVWQAANPHLYFRPQPDAAPQQNLQHPPQQNLRGSEDDCQQRRG